MTAPDQGNPQDHLWESIDLAIYEQHMSDAAVGQLQFLHQITGEQLTCYPSRSIGILGVAGGNGLDLIDPAIPTQSSDTTSTASTFKPVRTGTRQRLGRA